MNPTQKNVVIEEWDPCQKCSSRNGHKAKQNHEERDRPAPRKTAEEVEALWARWRKTPSTETRNALLEAYLWTVRAAAIKVSHKTPHSVAVEDLEIAGFLGLVDAIGKFDPARGVKFTTYSASRIHGSMMDFLREEDILPRLARSRLNKLERAYRKIELEKGRIPTDRELEKELGMPAEMFEEILVSSTFVSGPNLLKRRALEKDPNLLKPELMRDRAVPDPLEVAHARDRARSLSGRIQKREYYVLLMSSCEELCLREIATVLGISESRACQLHEKALRSAQKSLALGLKRGLN